MNARRRAILQVINRCYQQIPCHNAAVLIHQLVTVDGQRHRGLNNPGLRRDHLCFLNNPGIAIFVKRLITAAVRHHCAMDAIFIFMADINILPVKTLCVAFQYPLVALLTADFGHLGDQVRIDIVDLPDAQGHISLRFEGGAHIVKALGAAGRAAIGIQATPDIQRSLAIDQALSGVIQGRAADVQAAAGGDHRRAGVICGGRVINQRGLQRNIITVEPPRGGIVQGAGVNLRLDAVNQSGIGEGIAYVQRGLIGADFGVASIDQPWGFKG
ncbi:hypothetical protein JFPO13_contig00052-0001 [Edwardsiella piscicida]|nr:hypothetical protein JFPO13_contig00052-0001 [Edwardsiella piscicida]